MEIKTQTANRGNFGNSRAASSIKYIVIHYTGNDGDTAANNAKYYAQNLVKASAHYFVDNREIIQSVPDLRIAWAVGGDKWASCTATGGGKCHGKATNANSISIELCDVVKDGKLAPNAETVERALALTRELMAKYSIPQENVIRHFDVTGKLCPAYWSGKENAAKWKTEFWDRLAEVDYRAQLKARAGLEDKTMDYLVAYKWGDDLIRKLATMK